MRKPLSKIQAQRTVFNTHRVVDEGGCCCTTSGGPTCCCPAYSYLELNLELNYCFRLARKAGLYNQLLTTPRKQWRHHHHNRRAAACRCTLTCSIRTDRHPSHAVPCASTAPRTAHRRRRLSIRVCFSEWLSQRTRSNSQSPSPPLPAHPPPAGQTTRETQTRLPQSRSSHHHLLRRNHNSNYDNLHSPSRRIHTRPATTKHPRRLGCRRGRRVPLFGRRREAAARRAQEEEEGPAGGCPS